MQTAIELGYAAVRVHARTVEQKYQGRARWPFLKQIKEQYPNQKILGSGDVFTAEDVVSMLETTGVDAVWIARGAIGNPWIFQHAKMLLSRPAEAPDVHPGLRGVAGTALAPPTIGEQRDALAEHFGIAMQIHGESLAGRRMRKMGIKYSRFHPESVQVKRDFIDVHSLRDWTGVLDRWYAADGQGVWPAADAADEVNAEETNCAM
jgi:tRNA-dihydrouridine synthase